MPHNIGFEFFQRQDLTLGIERKQRHILVGSYIKAKELCLILEGLDWRAAVRRRKHEAAGKPGFPLQVLGFPDLVVPRRQAGTRVG